MSRIRVKIPPPSTPVSDRIGFDVPPHPADHAKTVLERNGFRCTRQRLAVYEHLRESEVHPTAEEVYLAVKGGMPNISLATVYKSLDALVRCGLAARLNAADGTARFDGRHDEHYHLRCLRSGRVEDLTTPYDPDLVAKLDPELGDRLRSRGFNLLGYRLELIGYYEGEAPPSLDSEGESEGEGDEAPARRTESRSGAHRG